MTARERTDQELTRLALAAGAGDREALASFVQGTQADVWRFCASLNGRAEADDLTQDTFARAIRSLPGFAGDSSARTWLLTIARRAAADSVRRSVRRRKLMDKIRAVDAAPGESSASPAGGIDLMALVDALSDERRTAFVLTQVLGLDYAEAAEVAGCPIGTIRSRVARARRDLVDATVADEQTTGSDA